MNVDENLEYWNVKHHWPKDGEEWSSLWGGAEPQWFSAILPRIRHFVPTDTILELGPGHGRWTNYLRNYCRQLFVVDLADNCIKFCQKRFAQDPHVLCYVNDGVSLAMIPDQSVDLVFSFDSLVHAEADVIKAYLDQLAKKLRPNGVGFIHHSNIGEYQKACFLTTKVPVKVRKLLVRKGLLDRLPQGRAYSMTAELFEKYCDEAGLQCIVQELVNWTSRPIDCLSLFTKKTSKWAGPSRVSRNTSFMKEANLIRQLYNLYDFPLVLK